LESRLPFDQQQRVTETYFSEYQTLTTVASLARRCVTTKMSERDIRRIAYGSKLAGAAVTASAAEIDRYRWWRPLMRGLFTLGGHTGVMLSWRTRHTCTRRYCIALHTAFVGTRSLNINSSGFKRMGQEKGGAKERGLWLSVEGLAHIGPLPLSNEISIECNWTSGTKCLATIT